jgi:hypothetical protein
LTKIPRTENGRSPGRPPEARPLPESDSPSATTDALIVRQRSGKRREARGPRVPAVYASVYEPCEGRTQRAFAYICPWCHLGHLGRAKTEAEVRGPRRSRCGRLVLIRAARVYCSRAAA